MVQPTKTSQNRGMNIDELVRIMTNHDESWGDHLRPQRSALLTWPKMFQSWSDYSHGCTTMAEEPPSLQSMTLRWLGSPQASKQIQCMTKVSASTCAVHSCSDVLWFHARPTLLISCLAVLQQIKDIQGSLLVLEVEAIIRESKTTALQNGIYLRAQFVVPRKCPDFFKFVAPVVPLQPGVRGRNQFIEVFIFSLGVECAMVLPLLFIVSILKSTSVYTSMNIVYMDNMYIMKIALYNYIYINNIHYIMYNV